ncbi:dipeptidase PepE [Marinomonas sp. 5E14-1]|uniref:dipeptidase PepE n=1 Tax=Marinomonas sp. 5E14-1 TaxID=3153922 RepID=UPI00326678A6
MQVLLLSSSKLGATPYLEHTLPFITDFIGNKTDEILFIPYAGTKGGYDAYEEKVANAMASTGYKIASIHHAADPIQAVHNAKAILVGGGNTFALLAALEEHGLIKAIQERVTSGTPYIGWSAGANVAGLSIKTTNDMPICQPQSFDALKLVPVHLNPHFTDQTIDGHNGESRSERLEEFHYMNPTETVLALPEGCGVKWDGDQFASIGHKANLLITQDSRVDIAPQSFFRS